MLNIDQLDQVNKAVSDHQINRHLDMTKIIILNQNSSIITFIDSLIQFINSNLWYES